MLVCPETGPLRCGHGLWGTTCNLLHVLVYKAYQVQAIEVLGVVLRELGDELSSRDGYSGYHGYSVAHNVRLGSRESVG